MFEESYLNVLLVFVVLVIIVIVGLKQNTKQNEILEKQTLKRNGTIKKRSLLYYYRFSFPKNGNEISIYSQSGGKNSPPLTYITCELNSLRNYKIKIQREIRIFGIGTLFGQDIKLNDPHFDENFVIQGTDEMIVRQFLTFDVKEKIIELKEKNPVLEIKKNNFKFIVSYIPKDDQQYDELIDAGLMLINRAQELG